ncbi:hypothetical protein KDW41_12185 [Burkholderia vietnamiensis]|nr:hypothetical protein [Burkholderia vietnamiensis]
MSELTISNETAALPRRIEAPQFFDGSRNMSTNVEPMYAVINCDVILEFASGHKRANCDCVSLSGNSTESELAKANIVLGTSKMTSRVSQLAHEIGDVGNAVTQSYVVGEGNSRTVAFRLLKQIIQIDQQVDDSRLEDWMRNDFRAETSGQKPFARAQSSLYVCLTHPVCILGRTLLRFGSSNRFGSTRFWPVHSGSPATVMAILA